VCCIFILSGDGVHISIKFYVIELGVHISIKFYVIEVVIVDCFHLYSTVYFTKGFSILFNNEKNNQLFTICSQAYLSLTVKARHLFLLMKNVFIH